MITTNIYNAGIEGYTVKGGIGDNGEPGHNVYYSTYNDVDIIKEKINNNEVLSDSYNDTIIYKENDVIIDSFAKMYIISYSIDTDGNIEKNLSYTGNIINQTEAHESMIDFSIISPKVYDVVYSSIDNIYKISDQAVEVFVRYNELFKDTIETIQLRFEDFTRINNTEYRLVINHPCGLTQEIMLDDNTVEIERKYFDLSSYDTHNKENVFDYIIKYGHIDAYNKTNDSIYRFDITQATE